MIRIHRQALPTAAQTGLNGYQTTVNGSPNYAAQVEAAKHHFSLRNRKSDPVFQVVRATLTKMCHGARRCMYCEDAPADELEHFRPKDLYPNLVFVWSNYLYACGICIGPKNNKWGLLGRRGAAVSEVSRSPKGPVVPPPAGYPALIDPSQEDALKSLFLDLQTFLIVPRPGRPPRELERAKYTIGILDLNKDFLIESRGSAFEAYLSHLQRARAISAAGAPGLAQLKRAVQGTFHPTVWAEMKRQRANYVQLDDLFKAVPQALKW